MQFWNDLINTLQLGTDKRPGGLPTPDAQLAAAIAALPNEADTEEKFLRMASLAFNYRHTAMVPLAFDAPIPAPAPVVESEWCSPVANQALREIQPFERIGLLHCWLRLAVEKGKFIRPDMLPEVITTVLHQRELLPLVKKAMGQRGKWMTQFYPSYQFAPQVFDEEQWHTGSPQQRKLVLTHIAASDPAKALQWIKDTWPKETAVARAELLKDMPPSLFENDLPWLEALLSDKSQKVNYEALRLLKRIPTSVIIQQYWCILKEAVTVTSEKDMQGPAGKTIRIQPPQSFDESLFKTGIEKVTKTNADYLTQEQMILYQMMEHIPLHFWEAHLQDTPENIIALFAKEKPASRFLGALGIATNTFRNTVWAPHFTTDDSRYFHGILSLLEEPLREAYMVKFFDIRQSAIIQYLTEEQQEEWGMEITRAFLRHAANNHYKYNRGFYNKIIHLIPVQIAGELEELSPESEFSKRGWTEISGHILQLLSSKSQIIQSFHSIDA